MAELLSPDPSNAQKQRVPMASRLQSPTSPFFLGSNDDQLERAQARAARAAAIRRKSIAVNKLPSYGDTDRCLGKQQILELFQNCIRLASENKINQKNTWELTLIDHLTEIIKVEENDMETNFQKASCTLEAGVKIYSLRVDSVHSEAYKVLGGMNRAGQENEQDTGEAANVDGGQEGGHSKKEIERKISPLSTLESSFEALNVKKFDGDRAFCATFIQSFVISNAQLSLKLNLFAFSVAFAVDPLYHQTSAQFDEGGAKGLLMNNLGVYGGCKVLFDSLEVPGKCVSGDNQHDKSNTIDLSFAREHVEQMVLNMRMKEEISPTLRTIVNRFDEDNRRPSDFHYSSQTSAEDAIYNEAEFDGDSIEDCVTWSNDRDDETTMVDEGPDFGDSTFSDYQEENEPYTFQDHDTDDRFEKVDGYLFLSLGLASKQNAWAGPEHWKYRKTKDSEVDHPQENGSTLTTKKKRNQKLVELEIDFTKSLDKEMPDIFAPPKNPKSLLLPVNKAPSNTKLPEDCHYQPENLVKLFLLPNLKCIGRRSRKFSDDSRQQCDGYGQSSFWDDDKANGDQYDDDESSTLVSQPRQVNKIEVQYDKTSKQVDVQALKETLWVHIQESHQVPIQDQEEPVSFRKILGSFPSDSKAAATINDVSPHLCFICLLHLANENGLSIRGHTNMDDLSILLPRSNTRTSGAV
ncbi:Condensin complex subunit 2/barren [Parasponia andersonii]|uniref:Condensin complex subunit 2 n=1 Tax=Parasponia andersonii TaxID=3476 RepID=A0A2P5B171_PARAD|nr:Condensin complex subunit 2/barren [Parasponia andersonii]